MRNDRRIVFSKYTLVKRLNELKNLPAMIQLGCYDGVEWECKVIMRKGSYVGYGPEPWLAAQECYKNILEARGLKVYESRSTRPETGQSVAHQQTGGDVRHMREGFVRSGAYRPTFDCAVDNRENEIAH